MAQFCALRSYEITNKCATSPDGITWTERTLPSSGYWNSIAWNGSVFCAISASSNKVTTSPDGITWSLHALPVSDKWWYGLTWNGSVFCAVSEGSGLSITSPDGVTWSTHALPTVRSYHSMAWNGSVFCAVAHGTDKCVTSPDGITWTERTLPSNGTWYSIAWNGSVFCAVNTGSNQAATSPDGITWTARTMPSTASWWGLAWNGSVFFTAGEGENKAATSPDGVTWTARTMPTTSWWRGVAWNGSVFCVVSGNQNIVSTSPDGVTWTNRNTPAGSWAAVAGIDLTAWAVPPPGATPFTDTFAGSGPLSAHTTDTGHRWVSGPNSGANGIVKAVVDNGKLLPTAPGDLYIVQPNVLCPDDFELEIEFDVLTAKSFGCYVYFDHAAAYYDTAYDPLTGVNWVGFGIDYPFAGMDVGNSVTGFDDASPAVTYSVGLHTVKVARTGSTVTVYLDGVLKITRGGMTPSLSTGLTIEWGDVSASTPLIPVTRVSLNGLNAPTNFWRNFQGQREELT